MKCPLNYFSLELLLLLRDLIKLTISIILIFFGLVLWWIVLVNKLWVRTNFLFWMWLYEHWPRNSCLIFVHRCSVQHCLIFPIAQYLYFTIKIKFIIVSSIRTDTSKVCISEDLKFNSLWCQFE
jgi:hypothetical protein